MPIKNLTKNELAVIDECLSVVASGKVILHDWEFQLLFGLEVEEFLEIYKQWPDVDDTQEDVALAINGAMNMLLIYPHKYHDKWFEVLVATPEDIERVVTKWRDDEAESIHRWFVPPKWPDNQ